MILLLEDTFADESQDTELEGCDDNDSGSAAVFASVV